MPIWIDNQDSLPRPNITIIGQIENKDGTIHHAFVQRVKNSDGFDWRTVVNSIVRTDGSDMPSGSGSVNVTKWMPIKQNK